MRNPVPSPFPPHYLFYLLALVLLPVPGCELLTGGADLSNSSTLSCADFQDDLNLYDEGPGVDYVIDCLVEIPSGREVEHVY